MKFNLNKKNYLFIFLFVIFAQSIILINSEKSNENENTQLIDSNKLSNHWLMKLNTNDKDLANQIANEHNFIIKRQVGSLQGYYIVESNHHTINKRSSNNKDKDQQLTHESIKNSIEKLNSHPLVESFEKEILLSRKKRDFIELPIRPVISQVFRSERQIEANKNVDPYWKDMWYLNRHNRDPKLPDMNVSGAWSLGYSGRGISVTFLDDGLERDHPDILQNYDPMASTDINNHDDDPMPRYEETNENKHGTRCAGEVAAVANNSICSVGIAFNSGIGGIRMLDGDVTDSVEAASLSFNPQHVHIYSASWGPDDNGEVVDGPGPLAKKAFMDGANTGRNGLGSIFVWASGNGGRFNDSCACDGYANSIYTLSISSTSENSDKPWYLEECASTLATTYSSGDERHGEKEIITTDIRHQCTSKHTGTSAAAPIAAGIIALALEANPSLTWRDIMYIIALTSRAKAIKSNNHITNKRGFLVSSRYGFGLMDAGRMVEVAKEWKTVPQMISCSVQNSNFKVRTIQRTHSIEAIMTTDACQNSINEVNYIEQVEIIVSVRAQNRGLLEIYLTSPMGTRSMILPRRPRDTSSDGFKKWSFMSVQQWGEFPKGDWKLTISSSDGTLVELESYELVIHGTRTKPVDYEKYLNSDQLNCNPECSPLGYPCGPTIFDCQICTHFELVSEQDDNKLKCVSYCPNGYYADFIQKKCIKCDSSCLDCNGSSLNCTSCPEGSYLKTDTNKCEPTCSEGYFINSQGDCEPCSPLCLTCEHEASYCLKCKEIDPNTDNFENLNLVFTNNYCVWNTKKDQCEMGTYYDGELDRCNYCDITCSDCYSGSQDSCIKCSDSRKDYLSEGRCVSECEEGFYLNEYLKRCIKCNSNCKTCNKTVNQCTSCNDRFTLNERNQCVKVSYYDQECSDKNCYECFGKNSKECSICKDGFSVFNGECVLNAPDGYFKKSYESSKGIFYQIEKCEGKCSLCSKDGVCTKCNEGFHLIGTNCFGNCNPGYYPTLEGTCEKCVEPCEKCLNKTQCLSCISNKNLFNGLCLDTCPMKYFAQNSICVPCHPSCETCTSSDKLNCVSCSRGFHFKNNECKSECPDGTYFDNLSEECSVCNSSSCFWCVKTPNTCTKCASNLALDTSTSTCKPCCSRSLRGKIKNPTCCNCAQDFSGYCLTEPESNNSFDNVLHVRNKSALNTFFVILLLIIAIGLITFSIVLFKRSLTNKSENYKNVRYAALEDS